MDLVAYIVDRAFYVYYILILVRVVLSYIRHDPYHPLVHFVYEVTEPVLGFFRRIIPPLGMVDLSPIVALFALELVHGLILRIL